MVIVIEQRISFHIHFLIQTSHSLQLFPPHIRCAANSAALVLQGTSIHGEGLPAALSEIRSHSQNGLQNSIEHSKIPKHLLSKWEWSEGTLNTL